MIQPPMLHIKISFFSSCFVTLRLIFLLFNEIAKKEVDGNIVEWSLESELSKTYWEVKVEKNGQQTDISIDAQSGNVLEVEVDD